jgi:hypothetical protein
MVACDHSLAVSLSSLESKPVELEEVIVFVSSFPKNSASGLLEDVRDVVEENGRGDTTVSSSMLNACNRASSLYVSQLKLGYSGQKANLCRAAYESFA